MRWQCTCCQIVGMRRQVDSATLRGQNSSVNGGRRSNSQGTEGASAPDVPRTSSVPDAPEISTDSEANTALCTIHNCRLSTVYFCPTCRRSVRAHSSGAATELCDTCQRRLRPVVFGPACRGSAGGRSRSSGKVRAVRVNALKGRLAQAVTCYTTPEEFLSAMAPRWFAELDLIRRVASGVQRSRMSWTDSPRLPPHGDQKLGSGRRAGTCGDGAERAQDPCGVRALQHRVRSGSDRRGAPA